MIQSAYALLNRFSIKKKWDRIVEVGKWSLCRFNRPNMSVDNVRATYLAEKPKVLKSKRKHIS